MRFEVLKSIGHNIADSLASGIGMLIGVYDMDVFAEAAASAEGFIGVDFLTGSMTGSPASPTLLHAVGLYRDALPALCAKQGFEFSRISAMSARFGTDSVYGRHYTVTVNDNQGRSSTDQYVGIPGRRLAQRRKVQ